MVDSGWKRSNSDPNPNATSLHARLEIEWHQLNPKTVDL